MASCPARTRSSCNWPASGSTKKIDALARKWFRRLPYPFPRKDRAAGFRYDVCILQAEFSRTQVFDRPLSGRTFFEQVIRDNLDAGRPDQVQLIFDRRIQRTHAPARFRTRVIVEGVVPTLHVDYKHSRIKQITRKDQCPQDRDHHQRHSRLRHR